MSKWDNYNFFRKNEELIKNEESETSNDWDEIEITIPDKEEIIYGPAARARQDITEPQIAEKTIMLEGNLIPEPLRSGEGSHMMKTALKGEILETLHRKVKQKIENAEKTGNKPEYSLSERYAYHKIEQERKENH